jgi:hypothetical protein
MEAHLNGVAKRTGGRYRMKRLVRGTGHYLNRAAQFDTSILGLIRECAPTVQEDR